MIVTRKWLEEWVDLSGIATDDILKKLNAVGLEVDSLNQVRIPEKIVVGHVLSCEKHPDADKLSVCRIDLGTGVRQIVCGAANIREGLYVPVATVGAVMPDGLKIKPAKLRGVESDGMVCSAAELGLPKMGEGILELDDSIGKLEVGKPLDAYPLLNDDIIEIELTANRGDCLSVYGVARELAAGFERTIQTPERRMEKEMEGIGRILHFVLQDHPPVSLLYRAVEAENLDAPLLMRLRLAWVDAEAEAPMDRYLNYATHTTGVILRQYDFHRLTEGEKARVALEEGDEKLGVVKSEKGTMAIVGVRQENGLKSEADAGRIVLEASYARPESIAQAVRKLGLETDDLYYRTSRGSEPDLEFGMNLLLDLLEKYAKVKYFSGSSEYAYNWEKRTLDISTEEIAALVGQDVELSKVVQTLSKLGFAIHRTEADRIVFDVPLFRHDIVNKQDVVEEIVRMVGIDNIAAKPLCFTEANRLSDDWKRYRFHKELRLKAAANGFFETIHYIFCDNGLLEKLGFEPVKKEKSLLNPITAEMDGLRPSLMVTMLASLQRNVAFSKRRIPLFELGRVFDTERNESLHMVMAYAGEKEPAGVANQGKPAPIDLPAFVEKVSAVIGLFDLEPCEAKNGLMHPYLTADIVMEGVTVGTLAKLHPEVAEAFDLPDTFFAELEMDKLQARHILAESVGALTPVQRDLSLLVPETLAYADVREALGDGLPEEIVRYFPIDRYSDEKLGDKVSLTLRFVIESKDKTLEEAEINAVMDSVLKRLETACGAVLR